ncbi:MAG: SDR family oxidoreductase [Pseudomonadota bacterium]|nr:SDR family oxidoreductase [Pseudomonadota bacterium]
MQFDNRFKNRHAVITGGASGIGLKVAERIIAEGGSVTIWDMDKARIDEACLLLGGNVAGIVVNVADPVAVEAAAQQADAVHQKVDVLICSAGVAGLNEQVINYPQEEWRRIIDINLNGLFYCNQAIAKHMVANRYGRIVNVASIAGKEGNPTASAYSASKAAVIGFTKSLGKELAKAGVTVNAITPATVDTPILKQVSEAHKDYMLSKIPMGRFGKVEEIAAIITWLASEECSFTTGAVFDISGGRATY